MASTGHVRGKSSPDVDTEILIAKLVLEDINDIEASRKGKSREDAPLTDEQLAIKEQAEASQELLGLLTDFRFALSMDEALEADRSHLAAFSVLNEGEEDDHLAALALSRGEDLPLPTVFQQALEDPSVLEQETDSGSNVSSDGDSGDSLLSAPSVQPQLLVKHFWTPRTSMPLRVECIICGDGISSTRSFRAPCSHYYCLGCLVNLAEASTRDETLYPLRCCKQQLPVDKVNSLLPSALRAVVNSKSIEFSTPTASRVYCSNQNCSAFLGAAGDTGKTDIACPECDAIVCSACKNAAHPGNACSESLMTLEVKALATAEGWQTCPRCNAIIELMQGCYHMTCRCSAQFCYLCATPWKRCDCRQWDEVHLEDAAERRVINEFGAEDAVERPAVHFERVYRQMQELRVNHECLDHHWRFRHGCGDCDECGDFLPVFLMRCTNCQVLACRRCSVNRL
ncbi:hypothetical protein BV22DRAFT_1000244 [Leucogyrophana mollusca]|uniref:Uncharacterized protein n=1 Tax=Leucogyrophana mollusca TaxID=85980 RepID=A0ACB8BYK7_9AGAM|nr:hypothetical protein BV22DRAFT_1000244 [Leucogyrophana mollusca]